MTVRLGFELEFGCPVSDKTLSAGLACLYPGTKVRLSGGSDIDTFIIKSDGSVDTGLPHDLEINTPVWDEKLYRGGLKKLLHFLTLANCKTNRTTGLHVNISSTNSKAQLDEVKLLLLTEERKWLKTFGRSRNEYCVPRRVKGKSLERVRRELADKDGNDAVNFRQDRVEFRIIGGDYLKREREVFAATEHFLDSFKASLDTRYRARRYARIQREVLRPKPQPRRGR